MISIVIICRNESAYIEECLESIGAAAVDIECEIVIVDGDSCDDTIARCRVWASLSRVPLSVIESAPGYARQRNAGVRSARFDWVAFVSADVRVSSDWLREIVASVHERVELMIGGFDLVPDRGRGEWMAPLARTIYPPVCGNDVERCSTVNLIARRDVLLAHPFDDGVTACEDKDFAARVLGSRRTPGAMRLTARPRHLARETLAQWLLKLYREAQAMAMLSRRRDAFPDCFGWRSHARLVFLLLLFALAIAAAGSPAIARAVTVAAIAFASIHGPMDERRPSLSNPKIVALHALSMLTVTAGVFAGFIAPVPHHHVPHSVVKETS